jgi:Mg2+/Co2+ transporter CorB
LDNIPLSALLIALAVLLVASAYFSLTETSMMAINRYRLRHLVKEGHRSARWVSDLLEHTDRLLGVILLGNNLLNAASALIVGEITRRAFGDSQFALAIATGAATFFILVFSEITPKILGAAYPEKIALPSSYILTPMLKLFYPVVWFVNLFVSGLLWILRLKPKTAEEHVLTMEELRTLVMEGGHYIPPKHQTILLNLFELENITVDDIMTPRHRIDAINIDASIEEIREQLATSHHTRVPVYAGELDNIVGVLHVRRVLHQSRVGELSAETLKEIMTEPYFIPAGTPLFTQLQNFQETARRVGLVVDEYGELRGMLTLEDVLEEVVGEFTSNAPSRTVLYQKQEDGSVLVEGTCLVRLLNRKLGMKFGVDGPKTVNGLVLEHFEDIPEVGTTLKIDNYPIEIVQTQDRMVKTVRIFPAIEQAPAAQAA